MILVWRVIFVPGTVTRDALATGRHTTTGDHGMYSQTHFQVRPLGFEGDLRAKREAVCELQQGAYNYNTAYIIPVLYMPLDSRVVIYACRQARNGQCVILRCTNTITAIIVTTLKSVADAHEDSGSKSLPLPWQMDPFLSACGG